MCEVKNIAILGSTGSVGVNALDVISSLGDGYRVTALTAGNNVELLAEQSLCFKPEIAAIADGSKYRELTDRLAGSGVIAAAGYEAVSETAARDDVDLVIAAIVGFAGFKPTLAALQAGHDVALANKETLVAGGAIVKPLVCENGPRLFPVDSEHAALVQCLLGTERDEVKRLVLTASGGPFLDTPKDEMYEASPERALNHPNWDMGAKITVDSATMMNKGLEVIEAHWLFDMPFDKIGVVIHPQSIVHSMVEFRDGSLIAQMGPADMRLPIQFALTYPTRRETGFERDGFSLAAAGKLEFREPDTDKFPCLAIAVEAGRAGGVKPAALNAANETAVNAFLKKQIPFGAITETVAAVFEKAPDEKPTYDNIIGADTWARRWAEEVIKGIREKGQKNL
jgi:1-deoxy-D-xylulose-5-phosphate reductoisomerase